MVAAAGSDGVYRRAKFEEMLYKGRGLMQYLGRVEVLIVESGNMEMVKPCDLSALPDNLSY